MHTSTYVGAMLLVCHQWACVSRFGFWDTDLSYLSETVVSMGSGNLLQNSGCEFASTPGDILGWEEVEGTNWSCSTVVAPGEGTRFFFAGPGATAELAQTVDIADFARSIDAGVQEFELQCLVDHFQSQGDSSTVVMHYLDRAKVPLDPEFSTGEINAPEEWMLVQYRSTAPIGSRYIQVRFIAIRYVGSDNDGYFDGASLRGIAAR